MTAKYSKEDIAKEMCKSNYISTSESKEETLHAIRAIAMLLYNQQYPNG